MSRIGLALSPADIGALGRSRLDLVLIAPGVAVSEADAERGCGCPARNLNRYSKPGAIAPASRDLARLLHAFRDAMDPLPLEALASQNDIYQYHLRLPYYLLTTLETALKAHAGATVVLGTRPYARYWSPMRPVLARLHDEARTNALLVQRLCGVMGVEVEPPPPVGRVEIAVRAAIRRTLIEAFTWWTQAGKVLHAVRDPVSRAALKAGRSAGAQGPVGVIVRTDSEVVSAKPLCDGLAARGLPFIILHDEMLSSQTTRGRLRAYGLPYVSLGALGGVADLPRTLPDLLRPRLSADAPHVSPGNAADQTLLESRDLWREMSRRLVDFAPGQRQFARELDRAIEAFGLSALVTFAYIDQWGTVIRETGARRGLKTIGVQNAAQDPEAYPRLCWSDHYCAESPWLKDRLVAFGYPSDRVTATGLPHFAAGVDAAGGLSPAERIGRKTITVLTQPIYEAYFSAIIRACAQLAAKKDLTLAIKYHPRQPATDYAEAIAEAERVARVVRYQTEPLDEVLAGSTAAVSVVSAALIRALFVGLPTFSMLPVEEQHLDLPYISHEAMVTVGSPEELVRRLSDFLDFGEAAFDRYLTDRRAYLNEHAVFEPGPDPTDNIVGIVADAMGRER